MVRLRLRIRDIIFLFAQKSYDTCPSNATISLRPAVTNSNTIVCPTGIAKICIIGSIRAVLL
jgi:hypothetical protein